jgi:hypothetical protein
MKLALAALAVLMFIPAAHADSSPPPPLEVTFSDTFLSDAGPTETLSGSFEWQPGFDGENGFIILSTAQDSSSGFLGPLGLPQDIFSGGFYAFDGQNGAEIDLFLVPSGNTGLTGNFFMFGCHSSIDCLGSVSSNGTNPAAFQSPESETFTVSAMPEPSLLAMLLLGILPLAFVRRRRRLS